VSRAVLDRLSCVTVALQAPGIAGHRPRPYFNAVRYPSFEGPIGVITVICHCHKKQRNVEVISRQLRLAHDPQDPHDARRRPFSDNICRPSILLLSLGTRPGYLALAVDGVTPGPGLAACSVGGIPAQCLLRVVGSMAGSSLIPLWDSNRVPVRLKYVSRTALTTRPLYRQCEYRLVVKRPSILACIIAVRKSDRGSSRRERVGRRVKDNWGAVTSNIY